MQNEKGKKKFNMKTKIKFLARLLLLAVFALFTNCEANMDIIEESALEHQTPPILGEKISFKQSKHFTEINSEIKSLETKFNKKQTSKAGQKETDSLKILTDEVLYVTYAGTHTYTFKVVRKNPTYLLENIVLHYNLRTKNYDEYLIQYKDLKEQDIKEISEGKLFKDSKKVIVTKLENGFFESHSSSNKGSFTSKSSDVICTTVTSTVWVECSQGVHGKSNLAEWNKCTAAVGPYAYQSTSTTCKVTSSTTQIPEETANPDTGGGGGNDPDVVIYNPLPLEPCDNSDEVDLNGNCLQPIDVAVSYIANCLSSNYATTLSQSEINFLHSTTSSFDIKNYLENNGCSSESSSFAKEMINYMRQNPDVTWEDVKELSDYFKNSTDPLKKEIAEKWLKIKKELASNPTFLLKIPCTEILKWQELIKFTPPQSVKEKIQILDNQSMLTDYKIQYLEHAKGAAINLDYFPVTINTLPTNPTNGQKFTPTQFLNYVRLNINSFVDTSISSFTPTSLNTGYNESQIWNSSNPLGAIIHINIPGLAGDGSVICSKTDENHWVFTTIEVPYGPLQGQDGIHPVSGNREFGLIANPNGTYTFYTRGVDRMTDGFESLMAENSNIVLGSPFDRPDILWNSLKTKIHNFVQNNGGSSATPSTSQNAIWRPDWTKVRQVLRGELAISDLGCN